MIKVLRIFNRFIIGGPSYNVFYLTKYIGADFETKLITGALDAGETEADFLLYQLNELPLHVASMQRAINPVKDFQAYRSIRKIIREFKPDIVHTHAAKPGTVGRLAALHEKVPVVVHTFHGHIFHSYFNKAVTNFFIQIERSIARKSTAIIAISDKQKEDLVNTYKIAGSDKVKVIPLGFELEKFNDPTGNKRKTFRQEFLLDDATVAIGIIGRVCPVKNHAMFIDAIAALVKSGVQNFKAFVVGDGELKTEMMAYAASKNILVAESPIHDSNAQLIFTSWRKDIDIVVNGLDIITLTSLNEGTPVSLIEAQAAGRSIVATNVGGLTDCLAPENQPFTVAVNDTAKFTEHLAFFCNNPAKLSGNSESIKTFILRKYSYHRLIDDTANLYRSLIAENKIK